MEQIDSYFPTGQIEDFKIFSNLKFPLKSLHAKTYGLVELVKIKDIMLPDVGRETILEQWVQLIEYILEHPDWCIMKESEPRDFWQAILNEQRDILIPWERLSKIRKLIRIVTVLPIGSAEAERGFSIMNHVRTKRRSKLLGSTIENIMRIRMNGPELDKFDAYPYVKRWVKEQHILSDDIRWAKNAPKKRTFDNVQDDMDSEETDTTFHTKRLASSALF